jgi:hypothetical protein
VTTYFDAEERRFNSEPRIFVRVIPESQSNYVLAVVDTAAPWCIFRPVVASSWMRNLDPIPGRVVLSTRLGQFHGSLFRGLITILASSGDSLDVEATAFLSPEWRGPNFLGYQGFLQRIRFAVDPENNLFYFGRI